MASSVSKRPFDPFSEPNGTLSPSAKKARTSPAPPTLSKIELWNKITSLPAATTQTILFQICYDNPSLTSHVITVHKELLADERAKPAVSFDSWSRTCWHALNRNFARMSSSMQFEMTGDVCDELEAAREAILAQAGQGTKWETRRNALETLRKISKSIMMCEVQGIRHEIMNGDELSYFAEAMAELAKGMTESERERYKEEGLYEKLVALQEECEWETDMQGLREVYEIFDGPDDGVGEDDEDDAASEDSVAEVPPPPERKKVFSIDELS